MEVAFFILIFCILFGAFLWFMTIIDKEAAGEARSTAEARQKHGKSTDTDQ